VFFGRLHGGPDLNERTFPNPRTITRGAVPGGFSLDDLRPERKRPALRGLGRMDAAAVTLEKRTLRIPRLAEPHLMAGAIHILRFERSGAQAHEFSGALKIRFGEINVPLLIATLGTARLTREANRIHSTIIIGTAMSLIEQFGEIDIYLFDQLLRNRITPGMRVLDAGCGSGRNLVYMVKQGYEVFGADSDPRAVASVRRLAAAIAPMLAPDNFRAEPVESLSFPDAFADVVLSSAVLHFARSDDQFGAMLRGTWRVLKPGGLLFCRLASSIGIETQVERIAGRRFLLPDGSERYLVDAALLVELTRELGGHLMDPLKTTVVQGQRSMTTWVVRKDA
jgi:tellurite methyltransferase